MWLSGAHSAFDAARGLAMAESRRQRQLVMSAAAKQMARERFVDRGGPQKVSRVAVNVPDAVNPLANALTIYKAGG